jgi:uncharacterized protein YbaP (TraB family)
MDLEQQPEEMIPHHYNLKNHLSASAYNKMRKHFLKSIKIDIERFVHVHPLLAISAVSQSLLEAEHQVSLDEHLWNFAKTIGKEMRGLETYEEQVTLLHSLDPVPLYRQLLKISQSPSGIGRQTHRTLNWYMKSDIHQLYRLTKSSMHGLRKRIIYDRNHVMAKRILEFSPEKTYFIAAGAGHLSGKYGILALLKHAGWKIRPIDLLA